MSRTNAINNRESTTTGFRMIVEMVDGRGMGKKGNVMMTRERKGRRRNDDGCDLLW